MVYLVVNNNGKWRGKIGGEINKVGKFISHQDQRRYQLPLLLRLARRVTAFSAECEVCRSLQSEVINLSTYLADLPGTTHQSFKSYLTIIKSIIKHLKRAHGLVEERQYVKRYIMIGLGFGLSLVLLSLILLNFGITLLALNIALMAMITRVIFSFTIGYALDKRARKQGRVL